MADPFADAIARIQSGWNANAGLSTVPGYDPNAGFAPDSFLRNNGLIPLSKFNALKYKQQISSLNNIAATIRALWDTRLSNARNAAYGGDVVLSKDLKGSLSGGYTYKGDPISKERYKELSEVAVDEEDDAKRPKSPQEIMAQKAYDEADAYLKALKELDLPDDPAIKAEEDAAAAAKKKAEAKPIEVGLNTFMAALAGQESSSGYRPSWASAPITQGFGPTDEPLDGGYNGAAHFNKGLDYGIPVGTAIDAATGGTVIAAGDQNDGWGISVKVRDANGYIHNYGHLSATSVQAGDVIKPGALVGKSGDTGKSTGPHLSYDVLSPNKEYIDPAKFVSGGGYDAKNPVSGAAGRFQIMPQYWEAWAQEAGLPAGSPMTPENQEYVAANKLQQYYNKYGDWGKVAQVWYAGEGSLSYSPEALDRPQANGAPSINQYVSTVLGRLGDFANASSQGTTLPDGTRITGGDGFNTGGSSGSGGVPKKPDPLLDYLNSGAYKLEGERAGEVDRRYDNVAKRMKDYLSAAGVSNDLLADIQNAIGNEVALKQKNQSIQDSAISTAASNNAAVRAGKLDYRDELAGSIWSNSLAPFEQELQALRAQMQTAPTGFADSILRTIPKNVPMEYYVDDELGLPGYTGDYWGQPTQQRYALGTIPRYATGMLPFHLEPYLAAYQAGNYVPSQQVRQFEELGYKRDGTTGTPATGTTPTNTGVIPAAAVGNSTYRPGFVPKNATLPPDMRVYDDGEWLDRVVDGMLANISAGRSAAPASWGLGDLSIYHGQPASSFPGSLRQAIRSTVAANADSPEIVQMFGARPGIETQWVPDPNAAPTKATPGTGGGGNYGTGANTQAQYGGTYGSAMDPYDAARLALEEKQLSLQTKVANAQIKLDQDRFELEKLKNVDAQAYQAAQIRWNDAKALLDQQNYELSVTQQQLQKTIFEDSVRRWETDTGMAREKLDLDKIRQAADLEYQAGQLELARAAGALSQAEYEEKKRQFEVTFGYQKEKDKKEQDMQRAKITVDYMAKPGNAVASNFWYGNREDPVGTAYDLFTGEDRGQKTWQQAYEEDATLYADANRPVNTYADGSMNGFMHDIAAILGDSQGNRATGNEEVVYNPTGAPLMVLSNEMSRALGFVPNRGKQFGNHVRKGGAA